jgi:hypothetical protein
VIKHVLIAAAVLLAGGVIAHFHVAAQSYQPMMRVVTPDGVAYTVVLDAVQERRACGVASEQFVATIKADCPECRVAFARCRREGEGLPAVAAELPSGREHSLVSMPGLSIRIDAPTAEARRTCEWIAESVTSLGVPAARCEKRALASKT